MKEDSLDLYFKNMFKDIDSKIVLDEEQIEAIKSEKDNTLIIAGAGTGKTTTMVAKVKYLVDIKHVEPEKILVMSYTKKTTKELEDRIVGEMNINAHVTTFHSLALDYLRNIFTKRVCYVLDYNEREKIFLEWFSKVFENKDVIKGIASSFSRLLINKSVFSKYFMENFEKYITYEEFFKNYVNYKIEETYKLEGGAKAAVEEWVFKKINSETPLSIKSEVMKSKAEAIIANFLYKHGLDYYYEKVYDELMDDNRSYKPDFTIDYGGKEIYLEYFGLSDSKYISRKKSKIEFHEKNNKDRFIYLDRTSLDRIEYELDKKLKGLGIEYNDRSYEDIYREILEKGNKTSNMFNFKNILYEVVDAIQSFNDRKQVDSIYEKYINGLFEFEREDALFQKQAVMSFYNYYFAKCFKAEKYGFGYEDLLHYSVKYFDKIPENYNKYEYVIVDEYQDISDSKFDLLRKTVNRSNSKLFVVGDDWQSIYSFSGSKIEFICNVEKYFPDIKKYKITKTYRNAQELIDVAGKFIMKNPYQIEKDLKSSKHVIDPIQIRLFDPLVENEKIKEEDKRFYSRYELFTYDKGREVDGLIKLLDEIYINHQKEIEEGKNLSILILGRTNNVIKDLFNNPLLEDSVDTKVIYKKFKQFKNIEIDAMTMHKSKGLTFDETIIIGMNSRFPSNINSGFWMTKLLIEDPADEQIIPFAEERRVFYVALTRTKNHVYILKNNVSKYSSRFINELEEIINDLKIDKTEDLEIENEISSEDEFL